MIPAVEEVLRMLVGGDCTHEQAMAWMDEHFRMAEEQAASVPPNERVPYREELIEAGRGSKATVSMMEGLARLGAAQSHERATNAAPQGKDRPESLQGRNDPEGDSDHRNGAPADAAPTPRTDAAILRTVNVYVPRDDGSKRMVFEFVEAAVSREIERELAEAKNRLWHMEAEFNGLRLASAPSSIRQSEELEILLDDLCGIQAGYEMAGGDEARKLDTAMAETKQKIRALFAASIGIEPRGCPTPGACSCPPLNISDDEVDALALHLCESENEHPEGTQNRFLNDGLHSTTFKEIAKRRVRVIVNQIATMRRSDGGAK